MDTIEERKSRIRANRGYRLQSELENRVNGTYPVRRAAPLWVFLFFLAWLIGAVALIGWIL